MWNNVLSQEKPFELCAILFISAQLEKHVKYFKLPLREHFAVSYIPTELWSRSSLINSSPKTAAVRKVERDHHRFKDSLEYPMNSGLTSDMDIPRVSFKNTFHFIFHKKKHLSDLQL